MIPVTTHTIVKNEENWIWYSLMSVKDLVTEMLVVDDQSTDNTAQVIKTIKDPKINYSRVELKNPSDLTEMRNKLVKETKTEWFIILDGDEVWNYETFKSLLKYLEKLPKDIYAVTTRTRNCIGDIYHFLPESSGRYSILGIKGNLNMRAYRKLPGFSWKGDYPLEAYYDAKGKSINPQDKHLAFFDNYYWHMTFLKRSQDRKKVKGWRSEKMELGHSVERKNEFPEVFSLPHPPIVPDPWKKMKVHETAIAAAITPLKKLRRQIVK